MCAKFIPFSAIASPSTSTDRPMALIISTTASAERISGISYEMFCATDRIAPSSAYLLFEPQPAMKIPITANPPNMKISTSPMSMFESAMVFENGSSDAAATTGTKTTSGAR